MNPFESMLNDEVFIVSKNGERTGPYKTALTSKKGFAVQIFDESLDVEEGYQLIRPLPNGKEEKYIIIETNYNQGLASIPSFWNLKLKKETSLANKKDPTMNTININNSQGIQIGNNNIQHIADGLKCLINKIDLLNISTQEKTKAKSALRNFLSNPTVSAILGGVTSGLINML